MASEQKSGQDGGQLEEARAAEEIVLQRLRDFGIPVPQSGSSGSGNSRTMVIIDGDEVTVIKRSRRKAPSLRGLYSMMARSGSVYAGPMLQSLYSLMAQSGGVYATSALQGLYSLMAQSGGVYATSALQGLYSLMAQSGGVYAGSVFQSLYAMTAQSGGLYASNAIMGLYAGAAGEDSGSVTIRVRPGGRVMVQTGSEADAEAGRAIRKFNR